MKQRDVEAPEVRRIRQKYSDGMPLERIEKAHGLNRRAVMALCSDVLRVKPERLKHQAAHVPRDL